MTASILEKFMQGTLNTRIAEDINDGAMDDIVQAIMALYAVPSEVDSTAIEDHCLKCIKTLVDRCRKKEGFDFQELGTYSMLP